ncbi:hypothetical protein NFI96_001283 [Prochilodus magdalenae]|nr:hypothetical protein NFI96_001283 [Prochilodus magdalenae]
MPSMSHPVSGSGDDCPYHHVSLSKDCSGVVPDCHGVTPNGSGSSSVTGPALVLVETPNESVCGGTVVSNKMDGLSSHVQKTWCPFTSTPTAPSAGTVPESVVTGRCPQDAAHRTLPTGRCPQDTHVLDSFVLPWTTVSQSPVPIQFQTSPVLAASGSNAVFTLQTITNTFSIAWIAPGGSTLGQWVGGQAVLNSVPQYQGRVTITATQLTISSSQLSDAGNYTVTVVPTATTGLSTNSLAVALRVFGKSYTHHQQKSCTQKEVWECGGVGKEDKVPADGAVGVEVEGHQVFWTCDGKPSVLVLTTVPPHTDSLGVSTKTKAGLVTEDDPLPF